MVSLWWQLTGVVELRQFIPDNQLVHFVDLSFIFQRPSGRRSFCRVLVLDCRFQHITLRSHSVGQYESRLFVLPLLLEQELALLCALLKMLEVGGHPLVYVVCADGLLVLVKGRLSLADRPRVPQIVGVVGPHHVFPTQLLDKEGSNLVSHPSAISGAQLSSLLLSDN